MPEDKKRFRHIDLFSGIQSEDLAMRQKKSGKKIMRQSSSATTTDSARQSSGNAIVPQVAMQIMEAIKEFEERGETNG